MAQQEDVLVPLVMDLVGDGLDLGALGDGGVAVAQVLVDVEFDQLDGLGLRHEVPPYWNISL